MVVSFESEKPDVVQNLQQNMPQWMAEARDRGAQMQEQMRRWEQTRRALQLLAAENVTLEVEETEDGITVKVVSDDPETAKQIKELLPQYFENLKATAGRVQAVQAGARGAGGRPEGGRPRPGAGDRAPRPGRRGREDRNAAP